MKMKSSQQQLMNEAEPVSRVKWLALGIFLGICVWGGCECCRYLMDGSVKTTGEVQRLTHLPVIGCYQDVTVKKNKIDQAIMQLQSKVIGKRDSLDYIGSADKCNWNRETACSVVRWHLQRPERP